MEESKNLYYYNSGALFVSPASPIKTDLEVNNYGLAAFSNIFKCFAFTMTFHDRSGIVKTPINVKTAPGLEFPNYIQTQVNFEEICNNRIRNLMNQAILTNRKLCVMWSGGVDSTAILALIIKNFDTKTIKDNVVVLLNNDSIFEYKNFYHDYVSKYFHIEHSKFFPWYIGNPDYIMVTGEGADQLFSAMVITDNKNIFGDKLWNDGIDSGFLIDHYSKALDNKKTGEFIFELFNKICLNSPVKIENAFLWFWYLNFTCKWQSVFFRSACFASLENTKNIKPFDNFHMFFSDEDFQLWSLNNFETLSNDGKTGYKTTLKKVIYDLNKDLDYYQNKSKRGSLGKLLYQRESLILIDESLEFKNEIDNNYFNLKNDFTNFLID